MITPLSGIVVSEAFYDRIPHRGMFGNKQRLAKRNPKVIYNQEAIEEIIYVKISCLVYAFRMIT